MCFCMQWKFSTFVCVFKVVVYIRSVNIWFHGGLPRSVYLLVEVELEFVNRSLISMKAFFYFLMCYMVVSVTEYVIVRLVWKLCIIAV